MLKPKSLRFHCKLSFAVMDRRSTIVQKQTNPTNLICSLYRPLDAQQHPKGTHPRRAVAVIFHTVVVVAVVIMTVFGCRRRQQQQQQQRANSPPRTSSPESSSSVPVSTATDSSRSFHCRLTPQASSTSGCCVVVVVKLPARQHHDGVRSHDASRTAHGWIAMPPPPMLSSEEGRKWIKLRAVCFVSKDAQGQKR